MGAHIAAQLLTTHPDRFVTATLGGAAGRFRWTPEELKRSEQEASEKERECVSRSQIYRLAATNAPKPTDEEIRKRSAECMANRDYDRFAQAALARSQKDQVISSAAIASVRVPTLAIVGSLDAYIADFQALKKLRPNIHLVVLDGATHLTAPRQPEFITEIRRFIGEHSSRH